MFTLTRHITLVAAALTLSLAPLARAFAGEPTPTGFAEPPPTPEPEELPSEALRIVAEEPITLAEPPAPVIEPPPVIEPTPMTRSVDARRPLVGTGLIVFGAIGMGTSALMMITAMAGPGWVDLDKREAAIVGGLALPVGLASMGLVLGGTRANNKYVRWAERNRLAPPSPGNGLLVGGAAMTLAGTVGIGGGVQLAITDPTPSRGNWAIVGVSGVITLLGLVITTNGMIARSRFAVWERNNLQPGTMALRGGAGLTLSGRF